MGQTWDANPIHDVANIASDVGGFFTGPPGDPGRIRQAAQRVEHLAWEYRQHAAAVTEAVDALTQTWGGDAAQAFHGRWYAGGGQPGPAHLLSEMHDQLTAFAAGLRDYATRLENKQHDHWIQMAALAALTVVNAVQLGADPATDAAEVGMGTAVQIGSSFSLPAMTTFASREAFALFASDLVGQLGAHVWDSLDPQSERNSVPFIDRGELASLLPLPACSVTGPDISEGDGLIPDQAGLTPDGRLENAESASIPEDKFANYAMDPEHPQNRGKWQAFKRLGYDLSTQRGRVTGAQNLIDQIREQLSALPAKRQSATSYGHRLQVEVPIRGPNGNTGTLFTVWQVDDGTATPKLITTWLKD